MATVAAGWAGPPAPAVRLLPTVLPHADLLAGDGQPPGVPFGIAEDDLGPVAVDFAREPHFLVFGDTSAGKSNLLRVLADGIVRRHSPAQARIIIVDYRRSLLEAVSGEHLIGYAPSAVLPHSRDIGLHVVIARASGGAGRAMFEPVLQRMRDPGAPGLLLSGSRDEGQLLGNAAPQQMPAGRGNVVTRGQPPRLVQVALLPPAS